MRGRFARVGRDPGQGGLNEFCPLRVYVRLEYGAAQAPDGVQNHVHVPCLVQDEQGRRSRLHEAFDVSDEVGAEPDPRDALYAGGLSIVCLVIPLLMVPLLTQTIVSEWTDRAVEAQRHNLREER